MGTVIQVEGLKVVRGHRVVIPGLTCAIPAGRVTGVLGPSGSGKSTLLRSIVGVQVVDSGTVRVLGEPAGSPGLRRRVAYQTQANSVYRDLTVTENVGYFASLVGAGRRAVTQTIEQVGLAQQSRQMVGRLSGGQLSRVSLACALVGDPEVLVLDEPTVGQDPVLRRELWDIFRTRAAAGATLLVSSHVMDEAARCDELLLLRDGELLAHQAPADLLASTDAQDYDSAFFRLVTREPR